ncbi:Na+:solute symporter [bacterium]|jgi:SSS family transporter|nr:Na+:solute symporter [bacterium]
MLSILQWQDYLIFAVYLLITVGLGLAFRRKASEDSDQYFLSGRSLPWWVLGTSMVATTFAADTPLAVTGFIRNNGIWFNWFGWHYVLSQVLAVFLFSRFWRRSGVMTDNELIEMRYSGKPAAGLRLFKAGYFAIVYNFIVMGWVLHGIGTVAEAVLGIPREVAIIAGAAIALFYALLAGFWGVVVTDLIQFVLAMAGSITLAFLAVDKVGGLASMREKLANSPQFSENTIALIPGGGMSLESDFFKFLIFITIMWWASHNADGGGYLIQRMAAAKNEKHARAATLWFTISVNALRYWPWIIVALCSMILIQQVPDGNQEAAYPEMMLELLGPGLLGLLMVSFFAAFMSTIDTHLNWGASYLVNDIWLRFIKPDSPAKQSVMVSKICVAGMMLLAVIVALKMTSIGKAWLFVWAMGAGVGPVLILRWFWWRVNAWSEIAALGSSLLIAFGFEIIAAIQAGDSYELFSTPVHIGELALQTHHKALILVPATIVCWVIVTFITRPVSTEILMEFYKKVRPGGMWKPIKKILPDVEQDGLNRNTMVAWISGVMLVYGMTFGIGQFVLGNSVSGSWLTLVAIVGMIGVVRELRRS